MKNDILPPPKAPAPQSPAPIAPQQQVAPDTLPAPVVSALPPSDTPPISTEEVVRRAPLWRRRIIVIIAAVLVAVLLAAAGLYLWYKQQLKPVSNDPKAAHVRLTIKSGTSPDAIASLLSRNKLIHDVNVFNAYTRIHSLRNKLQAGTYSLSPALSTPEIVDHLTSGKTDQISVTFLPGATLAEDRQALIRSGYSQAEVDAALNKTYDHPLFADKPAGTDLEGYIYGETYQFDSTVTVEQILMRTFDEFYDQLTRRQLIEAFRQQSLTLYQGITLASIIQREVAHSGDQKQVAQIFYTRLHTDMPLGSDVTYQYAAKKLGVAPTPNLDSPYNTRKNPGLPPGPIAVPGLSALEAVAAPASGDYVYFLSGDDDVTYFSHTIDEHEANIENHCQIKCATL